jgi:hypothetical protein
LEQSGRLRSTVYAEGSTIYIFNSDHTLLLRFQLRNSESPFEKAVSFRASDYDNRDFREEDGRVVFTSGVEGWKREKSCSTPELTFEDVAAMWERCEEEDGLENTVLLSAELLKLLDDSLSHVEISAVDGDLKIVQRNIYSGSIIEITRESDGFGLAGDEIKGDFGPIGLRTPDFRALFEFQPSLSFHIPSGEGGIVVVKSLDSKMPLMAVLAQCLYDELGGITPATDKGEDHGRQKPKVRRSQQSIDQPSPRKPGQGSPRRSPRNRSPRRVIRRP